jgi:conjugal transfer pilus assembly protein TraF
MKRQILSFTFFLLCASPCFAGNHSFYNDSERGWYYFEQLHKKNPTATTSPLPREHVFQQLEAVQKELELRKATLVMKPTVENARDYISFQTKVFENASQVSRVWQMALLQHPELDSRIQHPISQQASQIKYDEDADKSKKKLEEFARHFTLILFFKESCRYCQAFNPVLASFAEQYQFKVQAISIDGSKNETFKTEYNQKLIEDLGIETTPTLIAYNAAHQLHIPVAFGFATTAELTRNILLVYDNITNFQGEQ